MGDIFSVLADKLDQASPGEALFAVLVVLWGISMVVRAFRRCQCDSEEEMEA